MSDPGRSKVEGRPVAGRPKQKVEKEDMAKAGDELINPVTGLRTVFRKTAQDSGGELLQVDWIGDPGWTTGPDHVHPRQEDLPSPTPTGRTRAEATARQAVRYARVSKHYARPSR